MSRTEDKPSSRDWSGRLGEISLLAVVRRIFHGGLTGTLDVTHGGEHRELVFERGELRTAKSSREEHRLGAHLRRWGYISEKELDSALEIHRRTGARLDKVLVQKGLLTRSLVDTEAKRLMEEIVYSMLLWSDGSFSFRKTADTACSEDAFTLSSVELIIEGVRRIPESEPFLDLLEDLHSVPTISTDLARRYPPLSLPNEVAYLLRMIDGRTDGWSVLELAPGFRMASLKILYALIYCGLVQLRRREVAGPALEKPVLTDADINAAVERLPRPPGSERRMASERRDLVRNTYRRIDWLSYYDLLEVPTDAATEEIEEAYRAHARIFDPALRREPDLYDCDRELTVLSERIRVAHEVLVDAAARHAYDQKIREAATLEGPPTESPPELRRRTAAENYKRAKELIEKNDYFPAIRMLEEAVRFTPDNAEYRFVLGRAQIKNRYWRSKGIENLKEAARLDPSRADVQIALARALRERGSLEEADYWATKALQMAPTKRAYQETKEDIERALDETKSKRPSGFFGRLFRKE